MGAGSADVFAMYCYDDSVVGRFFTTGGGSVRNGTNNRQFCGDNNPGCYSGVHANGEVWMGAAWKVRQNLKSSLGPAAGFGGGGCDVDAAGDFGLRHGFFFGGLVSSSL